MKQDTVRIPPSRSGVSLKIGTKILALVSFLLALLGTVSAISLWQMNKIGIEIEGIAQRNIPLTRDLTEITIHQLEQAINFERAFRAGEIMIDHAGAREEFDKAVRTFKDLTGKIETEFGQVKAIVQSALDANMPEDERQEFLAMLTMLDFLDAEHKDYDRLARMAFKLIAAGKLEQALALLPMIEVEQEDLDHQLEKMLREVESFIEDDVNRIDEHEQFALKLLLAITGIALIFGMVAAVYIVRRSISRPLSEIVTGLEALGADDMSVEVKVHSNDEIGAVAKAYANFKATMIQLKITKQKLETSQQRYKQIVEGTSDWIWECDEQLRFTYMSESFERIAGVSAELVLGKTRHEIGKEGKADWESHLEDLAARRPFRDFRYAMAPDNGHIRYWSASGAPVFDDKGEFKGYRGTGCERTEQEILDRKLTAAINARKQTQQALNASWRRFVDIAELSQDWIWESDDDHIITYMSDHFFTKTGMDRNKILNQRWDEIGIKSGMKKLHEKLELQQPFHDVNISTQAVKGKTGQFLISGKPVIDETNTFNGYRGVGICASAGQASDEQSEESKEYSGRLGEFINLAVMEEAAADGEKDGVQLTPREAEILDWVKQGKSYADIANILSISRRTIEFHISNVVDKLGASNRVSAVVIAMRRGILGS